MVSFLFWTALLVSGADPAPPALLAEKVTELVRRLDARELAARDEAEARLLEMGADVLPLLPAISPRTSAETASRVTRLHQKLLRAQALAAAGPTLVTLAGDKLPAWQALEDIAKQTGNPINDHRAAFGEQKNDATVSFQFDKTPYWRAMDSVLDQAGLTLYGFSGARGAAVINRPPGAAERTGKAFYAGVFRLEAARFEAVRDLRNEQTGSLKLFLEVTWEPRLQPFAILQPLSEVHATANTGGEIAVANADAEPEALIREGTSMAELEIPLALPPRSTEMVSVLKGKLLALVPGPLQDFRFSDLKVTAKASQANRLEQRKAGTTVTIDQLRKNNAAWEVALRVKFEAPSAAMESHRGWILENEAYFTDAKGERIEPGGLEQTLQSKDEVGLSYYFDLPESPEKMTFVYRTPITVLEMGVDYEFRNLRLP